MAMTIYQGDVGLEILADCGRDIAGAGNCKILVKTPSGVIKSWPASTKVVDGQTRFVSYITKAGDLDEAGTYSLQANLSLGDWSGSGKTGSMKVKSRLT